MDAREAALKILAGSEQDGAKSDELLSDELSYPGLKPIDRGLLKELVSGVLRNRSRLDFILDGSLKKGVGSLTVWERNILRLGLYQIAHLDRIPQSAAVNESVKLAKRFSRPGTIGLTNAILRDIIRNRQWTKPLDITDSYEKLSVEYSHPEWLVRKWLDQIGIDETDALLEANNRPAPVTIRVNRLKTSADALFHVLEASGFEPRRNALAGTALDLGNPAGLIESEPFRWGLFYIQDAAAQVVSQIATVSPGQRALDLCAAPGGKLTAFAEMTGDDGLIIGVDIGQQKIARIRENLRRLGVRLVRLVCADAATFTSRKRFDLVLADVPCSGLGVLRRRMDLRWRIGPDDIPRLAALQAAILGNAATLVEPGGRLIYSTCTLTPEENEQQISRFLERHSEFKSVKPGLPDSMLSGSFLYLWPHRHQSDGAFAACLEKMR
ncbi:MAG: 16S rRNA (cytosine(967)-C(5))-methyltransferase RsmB [Candidatus Edwardsbacteria bacterium]|nr:16S rRNA (cytosine(967)-C(5))-methyltransferase RsmB [Candidatus Edwardsbacteria bacterium]